MAIYSKCPKCGNLQKLPVYPVRYGFICKHCAHIFFRPEQYRNKELKRLKKDVNIIGDLDKNAIPIY